MAAAGKNIHRRRSYDGTPCFFAAALGREQCIRVLAVELGEHHRPKISGDASSLADVGYHGSSTAVTDFSAPDRLGPRMAALAVFPSPREGTQ